MDVMREQPTGKPGKGSVCPAAGVWQLGCLICMRVSVCAGWSVLSDLLLSYGQAMPQLAGSTPIISNNSLND
jgi:hypothetical protein